MSRRTKEERSAENAAYWAANGEKRNAKRRARYAKDRKYRNQIKGRARRWMRRERRRPTPEVQHMRRAKPTPTTTKLVEIDVGKGRTLTVLCYYVGALAKLLDRSSGALVAMETRGVIPPAIYRDARGRRLYPDDQVQAVVDVFVKHRREKNLRSWDESAIPNELRALWSRWPLGINPERLRQDKDE